ncbi:hypothetical protein N184_12735 [Sinorhizobium sp. GL28]|nr:hypothetical protein N184_12735 [Sinorhizobium sp. GL28]
MRSLHSMVAEYGGDIFHGDLLAVLFNVFGDIGGRIATRIEGDAPVAAGEPAHLELPIAMVTGELMNENNGFTSTRRFGVKVDSV